MKSEKTLLLAQHAHSLVKSFLDSNRLKYDYDDQNLNVVLELMGDDLKISLRITADAENALLVVISQLPFKIKEDCLVDFAIGCSYINNIISDGNLEIDLAHKTAFFRMTVSFFDTELDIGVIDYLISRLVYTVDKINDKLFMLASGNMDLQQFLDTKFGGGES